MNQSILVNGDNICKYYSKGKQQVKVLDQLDIEIKQGEFVALMGPSGSGKTTFLNLIGGLDRLTSGTLNVGGHEISSMSFDSLAKWRSRYVSFIFQSFNLLDVLTAHQNVELPLLLTKLSRKERYKRAMTALDIVGLKDRWDHYPTELSGGQEQRVAIARAFVSDPTLLLADEPTGNLDRDTADGILTLLQALNREHGKTIVMVTHDPKAAEYANATLNFEKGCMVECA